MKKNILILCSIILCLNQSWASQQCFIAKENGKILVNEGDCKTKYGPQSTFKIALSLIGFDSGILKSESNPSWSLPKGTDPYINICKGDHNPRTWMRDSCLWYSKILTSKLGMKKFDNYVTKFSYGNMDLSRGLTEAWVSSSLKISPDEQTEFLQKIVDHKLSLSHKSYEKTKKIMFIQELGGGWMLYGKTGNGNQVNKEDKKIDLQQGWFVGYIEKGKRIVVFASHIADSEKQSSFASMRAKNEALLKLWNIIEEHEK